MSYCQLGTTLFNGLKSFVSFSQDESAVLVEHALISRKPRLQGSGIGLQVLTLSLALHQEFCQVSQEISALRKSKDSFEILPLLWGNGKIEGRYVIEQLTVDIVQQDDFGNVYAAVVNVVLKESVTDNTLDQLQLTAQMNAFAVGDKKPATKSKRVNPPKCEKLVSDRVSDIRSRGGVINSTALTKNTSVAVPEVRANCDYIIDDCKFLTDATASHQTECVFGNTKLSVAAKRVSDAATSLKTSMLFLTDLITSRQKVSTDNANLQSAIATLCAVAAPIAQKTVV